MSKRKRSWESSTISSQEQTAEIALAGYEGQNFARTSMSNHGVSAAEVIQNLGGDGILPYEAASIDQRLHEASKNGPSIEGSWKPEVATADVRNNSEAFPSITRKITACDVCRKQKIKCEMPNDRPPCVRCSRRGVQCVLNKSLQTLLDGTKQTELLQSDVQNIHETLDNVCRKLGIPLPRPLSTRAPVKASQDTGAISSDNDQECEISPPTSPSAVQAPIDTFLEVTKLGSPTSADTPHSLRQHRPNQNVDLIGKGIISLAVAENLAQRYFSRLDHYLYGIGSSLGDLQSLRHTSPILIAAICTVSALHDPKDQSLYEACNREFRRRVSRSVFEKRGIDHLQALCIGSFWLTDASRILCSDALRRAADTRLHKHFQQLLQPQTFQPGSGVNLTPADHTNRIRLWYLLFICDQHLSILHNRDPLLRTDKEITANWELFLEREGATDSDVRLISQVALLLIMGQVRDTFGSELDDKLSKGLAIHMLSYSKQLDMWYNRFSKLFMPNPHIGNFPMRGLQMHYQFGKLYLGHHVFKGLKGEPIPPYFLSLANTTRDAAVEIFDMIIRDPELQQSLVGMPHYFHIMIAFAGHFLLEVCSKYHSQLSIDLDHNFDLISRVLNLFQNLPCIPQHPISRMTAGLARKLMASTATVNMNSGIDYHPSGVQEMAMGHPNRSDSYMAHHPPDNGQQRNNSQFVPGFIPPPIDQNGLMFSDFEQFSFPEMTINFMS